MANVLNRITKEYLLSVNEPDFPLSDWIHNPIIPADAQAFPSRFWNIVGDVVTLQNTAERDITEDNETINRIAETIGEQEFFGTGEDGDTTLNVNMTLPRDVYPNILTIPAGVIIDASAARVICRAGLVCNGTLFWGAQDAVGATPGTAAPTGSLATGGDGAPGGADAGVAGESLLTETFPGVGGNGGAGGAGALGSGGAGGTVPTNNNLTVRPSRFDVMLEQADTNALATQQRSRFRGGAGGGSGAGDGGLVGGAGGQGGHIGVLAAPIIFIGPTGLIHCDGGAGGNGQAGGNTGGGGGGGGGRLTGIFSLLRNRGVFRANGGAGGLGQGTGANGSPGAPGVVLGIKIR